MVTVRGARLQSRNDPNVSNINHNSHVYDDDSRICNAMHVSFANISICVKMVISMPITTMTTENKYSKTIFSMQYS